MSRSGYTDEWYGEIELYRANVGRALGGKRGQAFLRELLASLDAIPDKRLIAHDFEVKAEDMEGRFGPRECGVCAIAAVGLTRGMDMSDLHEEIDADAVGRRFGIAGMMAAEIEYMNDEAASESETSEERWLRMRNWVSSKIHTEQC